MRQIRSSRSHPERGNPFSATTMDRADRGRSGLRLRSSLRELPSILPRACGVSRPERLMISRAGRLPAPTAGESRRLARSETRLLASLSGWKPLLRSLRVLLPIELVPVVKGASHLLEAPVASVCRLNLAHGGASSFHVAEHRLHPGAVVAEAGPNRAHEAGDSWDYPHSGFVLRVQGLLRAVALPGQALSCRLSSDARRGGLGTLGARKHLPNVGGQAAISNQRRVAAAPSSSPWRAICLSTPAQHADRPHSRFGCDSEL